MSNDRQQVAVFDVRPFFERALVYGVGQGIIDDPRIDYLLREAPKGMVQIAEYFGTSYLRANVEAARLRIVNLVSLFLEDSSGGDLQLAACSLRDNSFLSHSRGGSEMLKRLWSLPEDSSMDALGKMSQKTFLDLWSLRSLADYRVELTQRQACQAAIVTARGMAERAGIASASLSGVAAEAIIRSTLLVTLCGATPTAMPNGSEFVALLTALRKKGVSAKGRKRLAEFLGALPAASQAIASDEWQRLEKEDLPRIADSSLPIDGLISDLAPLYFLRDFDAEDASGFDAAVSTEWRKITGGKSDDHSLLTVFVCLAAGVPPKPTLSKAAARALIRKARTDGFKSEPVVDFLRTCAPFPMQDDLAVLWQEFFPEAESYILDASDRALGDALAYLKDNCVVL